MTAPTTTVRMATDKQIKYLTVLVKKHEVDFEIGDSLTAAEASELIDQAKNAPERAVPLKSVTLPVQVSAPPATPPAGSRFSVEGSSLVELLEAALEKARYMGV